MIKIYKYRRSKGINCVKESPPKQWRKAGEIFSFTNSDKDCLKFQNKNSPLKRRNFEKTEPSMCQNAGNLHRVTYISTDIYLLRFKLYFFFVFFTAIYSWFSVFEATNTTIPIVFPRLLWPCYVPLSCEVFRPHFHTKYVCVNIPLFLCSTCFWPLKKVNQSHYRPEQAQRVPGS